MRHNLLIDLDARNGALLRVLALVERRGFTLQQVDADALVESEHATTTASPRVALAVDGSPAIDVLLRQIQRLIDVRSARIASASDTPTEDSQ